MTILTEIDCSYCHINGLWYNILIPYKLYRNDVININELAEYLNDKIKTFPGTWSYLIQKYDPDNPPIIAYNENYVHKSASMIKVLILAALCASKFDFDKKIRIDTVPRVEGGGALQEMNSDARLTIGSAASLMIVLSDNLATNLLIKKLGLARIQRYAHYLGLEQTKIQRCMMDFEAAKEGKENYMSVSDYNKLLWYIYEHRHLPKFETAWKILGRQQFRDRIPYYWDEDIIFHHKTGMLDHVEHDGGIYEGISGTYSIIIFASDLPSNAIGGRQMGELGKYILDYLETTPYLDKFSYVENI